jgi:hypothetical protein
MQVLHYSMYLNKLISFLSIFSSSIKITLTLFPSWVISENFSLYFKINSYPQGKHKVVHKGHQHNYYLTNENDFMSLVGSSSRDCQEKCV